MTYAYDAAGNRTSMTDGLGSASYAYDQLSRMTSETRSFTGVGSYTLTYNSYNLSGELTSFTNHWNAQVGYGYDKAGRLISVSGSGYAGVTSYVNSLTYRAFGGIKAIAYNNGRSLGVGYDNRLRPTTWNVSGVLGYNYNYNYLNEHTGRVTYAQNIEDGNGQPNDDGQLDRSYEYDHVGRLAFTHSGAEARAHAYSGQWGTMDGPFSLGFEYDVWGNMTHRYGWGGEVQGGSAGQTSDLYYSYGSNNRRTGFTYDNGGNLTNDLGQIFTYDATGQQATSNYNGPQQYYDCDRLRVKKVEGGLTTLYLRSSVFGGQVVAELNAGGQWARGYVYAGSQLLAVQQSSSVNWVHEDPIAKSKRITNSSGAVVSTIELDPWGADTNRSNNAAFQPHKFTTYERDGNGSDEAMFRRHNRWHSRFDQPDPYDGSYDLTDPQSLNRYSYVQNDPVNFVDPSGLDGELGGALGSALNLPPGGIVDIYGSFDIPGGAGGGGGGDMIAVDPFEKRLETFGGALPQNPPTLTDAIDSARKALEADPCKSMFSKGNGLDKLNELVKKKKIKIGDAGVPKTLSPTGRLKDAPGLGEIEKGGKIFLNPSSTVMKGTYPYDSPTAAFGGLSPTNALAALIIHGVLHVTKDIEPDGTSPNDSLIHNADVARNCFPKPNP